ncbi:MAG: DNA replication regulator sld2 [Thelocarpon impressellum]|nr:MAG: DNA replication regulator sld2 [Thelocarpon impressellum]
MSVETESDIPDRATALRQELKEWEQLFAAANSGRKAGREDIKKNPAIEYTKLRDILSGKAQASSPRKRKRSTTVEDGSRDVCTPKRVRAKNAPTPSRIPHPAAVDPYDSPSAIRVLRKSIGPTPQKDGQVLGLFDLMSDDEHGSPAQPRTAGGLRTPHKTGTTPLRAGRTPASSGKRFLLDSFATPTGKRKAGEAFTPVRSVSKLQFSTPAFLRRDSQRAHLGSIDEGDVPPVCMPPKPPVRGLSSILANLRQMEDEALDDDMDALREVENEATDANKEVEDDEASEQLGRDGKPLKVWTKKGQKRTTRRVIMRPAPSKPVAAAPIPLPASDQQEAQESHFNPTDALPAQSDPSAPGEDDEEPQTARQSALDAALVAAEMARGNPASGAGGEGPLKRAARKVRDSAHANFRRLKIRGAKGAKAGGGGRGKRR